MLQTLIFTGSSATVLDCLYILVHCSNFVRAVFSDYGKLQCPAWSFCVMVFFWSAVFVDLSMSADLSNKKRKKDEW